MQSVINTSEIINILGGLMSVIVIVLLFAYILKKVSNVGLSNNKLIKIIGGVALGNKEKIVLVEVADHQLLLGISQGGVNTLYKFDEPISIEKTNTNDFKDKLKQFMSNGKINA